MGFFTRLELADARALGASFDVDVVSVEALAAGSVNSNFRLVDAAGHRYFARVYEEQAEAGARAELQLLRELERAGIPVAAPLSRADGTALAEIWGKPFAMYHWLDGDIVCQARVTPDHCRAVGAALGRLHAATPRLTPLAEGRFRVEDLFGRLDRVEAESPPHRDVAKKLRERLEHYRARRKTTLPSGIVHGDLFRDNVLWKDQKILALIDFESASQGTFAFDLMVTVLAWCYGSGFDAPLVRAMFDGYGSERALELEERAELAVEGAIACLRFATTRITDFSMRARPGEPPLRDYRRFVSRLEALEAGVLREVGVESGA